MCPRRVSLGKGAPAPGYLRKPILLAAWPLEALGSSLFFIIPWPQATAPHFPWPGHAFLSLHPNQGTGPTWRPLELLHPQGEIWVVRQFFSAAPQTNSLPCCSHLRLRINRSIKPEEERHRCLKPRQRALQTCRTEQCQGEEAPFIMLFVSYNFRIFRAGGNLHSTPSLLREEKEGLDFQIFK